MSSCRKLPGILEKIASPSRGEVQLSLDLLLDVVKPSITPHQVPDFLGLQEPEEFDRSELSFLMVKIGRAQSELQSQR